MALSTSPPRTDSTGQRSWWGLALIYVNIAIIIISIYVITNPSPSPDMCCSPMFSACAGSAKLWWGSVDHHHFLNHACVQSHHHHHDDGRNSYPHCCTDVIILWWLLWWCDHIMMTPITMLMTHREESWHRNVPGQPGAHWSWVGHQVKT